MQTSSLKAHSVRAVKSDLASSEVCPLCMSRYAAVLECVCASCEAPSCPECAAPIAGTHEVLCYACLVPTTH